MFSYFKTMLFYLKRAESGQTSLWLTVIGCSGQSSYYYLAFLLQGLIGFERERVLIRQKPPREDQERTFVIITPFIYSSLVFDFAGTLVRISVHLDCFIFCYYTCYIFTLTFWFDSFMSSRVLLDR